MREPLSHYLTTSQSITHSKFQIPNSQFSLLNSQFVLVLHWHRRKLVDERARLLRQLIRPCRRHRDPCPFQQPFRQRAHHIVGRRSGRTDVTWEELEQAALVADTVGVAQPLEFVAVE